MNPTELRILRTVIKNFPAVMPHLTGKARWVAYASKPPEALVILRLFRIQMTQEMIDDLNAASDRTQVMKSYDYFLRQLERLVRSVYAGNLGGDFMDVVANLISGQLTDAYQQAIDDAGLSPDEVTDAMKQQLDDFIMAEYEFVRDFYEAIVDARTDDTGIDPLLSRASLWANRWRDVNNAAKLMIGVELGQNLEWVEGDTIKKCPICVALNGIVAGAKEWDELGVRPQNAPNPALSKENDGCEGWGCDCELRPTDKRRSAGAYNRIVDIVSGGA